MVGPCVAAPLAGALLYIGQSGDAILGRAVLFCMALGMGAVAGGGSFCRNLLAEVRTVMEAVKKAFGVVLLATALWIVSPLIPTAVQMGIWALLLIVPAIFMHALDSLAAAARDRLYRFWKGIGVVMLTVGAACLLGALSGAKDPLRPLAELGRAQKALVRSEACLLNALPRLPNLKRD